MTAEDTALNVLNWALRRDERSAAPVGDLVSAERLVQPQPELRTALAALTMMTAARLRLRMPGELAELGTVGFLIAAAIGGRRSPGPALLVLSTVDPPAKKIEWLAVHGVVAPAMRQRDAPEIIAECLWRSPLTMLLNYPMPGENERMIDAACELIEYPSVRASFAQHLACPTDSLKMRRWQATLLDRLWLGNHQQRQFVLDVYENAMTHFEDEILAQVNSARSCIVRAERNGDDADLVNALSVAEWWGPLWKLHRVEIDSLRQRRYLGYNYHDGISLYRMAQSLPRELVCSSKS